MRVLVKLLSPWCFTGTLSYQWISFTAFPKKLAVRNQATNMQMFCASEAYTRVRFLLGKQKNQQRLYYDTKVHVKAYKKGDYVWLHCPAVPKGCSRKLHRPARSIHCSQSDWWCCLPDSTTKQLSSARITTDSNPMKGVMTTCKITVLSGKGQSRSNRMMEKISKICRDYWAKHSGVWRSCGTNKWKRWKTK